MVLPGWIPALFIRISVPPNLSRTDLQFLHLFDAADIGLLRHDAGGAFGGQCREKICSLKKPLDSHIGDANLQTQAGETACRRKADACRSARYHGYGIFIHCGVLHFEFLPLGQTLFAIAQDRFKRAYAAIRAVMKL
jgi:hypothetical protein